jgi:alkylhydroperoxidase family enzyme
MGSHGAVASYALGEDVWNAVKADWRTAPVSPGLRATLGFIEKQTLRPDELTHDDAEAVYAAGVSKQALHDAAQVSAMFNMIVRLADAFGWDVPDWDALRRRAPMMLDGGYAIAAIVKRV